MEPRGPGVGRSRGWSVAVSEAWSNGGLWGGTGSRLGLSRGLSEPARPRDRPKISDTFSPKPHTDSAGGDTENIFFLFLPPHPPHLPPSPAPSSPSRPRSSLPCLLPLPGSLLGALGLGGGWWWEGGWAGRLRTPGSLCPSHLLGFRGSIPGRPGKAGRRGQCPGPMMPPFLSGAFPLPAI